MKIILGLCFGMLFFACQHNDANVDSVEESLYSNVIVADNQYSFADNERSYVVIPWEAPRTSGADSVGNRELFDKLKREMTLEFRRINKATGYEGLKISSIQMDWSYNVIVIRTFESLIEADSYSRVLRKELDQGLYGKLKFIVPVNYIDYRTGIEIESFEPYQALYTKAQNRKSTVD